MKSVFVTGTDTGVGKTLVSAILARAWNATYWKPVQTGLAEEDGDTPTVAALAGLAENRVIPPAYAFAAPLSPLAAARHENARIDPARLTLPEVEGPLVVEGAGGLMVPVTEELMMIDLIARLGLPVALVTRTGLGTLNHTLLSLEALRARGINVAGIVPSGPENAENVAMIERFGNTRTLFSVPFLQTVSAAAVAAIAARAPRLSQ